MKAQNNGAPAFAEPWQAQALGLSLALQRAGHVSAGEWAAALGAAIKAAQAAGDADDGTTYYLHVLTALESLVVEKRLSSRDLLAARKVAWTQAYNRTPHGEPVRLE